MNKSLFVLQVLVGLENCNKPHGYAGVINLNLYSHQRKRESLNGEEFFPPI